jgi:hypothetical protein
MTRMEPQMDANRNTLHNEEVGAIDGYRASCPIWGLQTWSRKDRISIWERSRAVR